MIIFFIFIIIIMVVLAFLQEKKMCSEGNKKRFSFNKKMKVHNLEYEEITCETSLNAKNNGIDNLFFSTCKIACEKDSLYIFDNYSQSFSKKIYANPLIIRNKKRKINSTFVRETILLNTNSFGNAVHIEIKPYENMETIYTIRLFNVSDLMKEKINDTLLIV